MSQLKVLLFAGLLLVLVLLGGFARIDQLRAENQMLVEQLAQAHQANSVSQSTIRLLRKNEQVATQVITEMQASAHERQQELNDEIDALHRAIQEHQSRDCVSVFDRWPDSVLRRLHAAY